MKLNFNEAITDPSGTEVTDAGGNVMKLSEVLAGQLLNAVKTDENNIVKHFLWGMGLAKGETIDLDKTDQKYLREFVITSPGLTVLTKGKLLVIMDNKSDDNVKAELPAQTKK